MYMLRSSLSPMWLMFISRREIFGPVLPIVPVENLEEAIIYVNAQ
jgi:acyl-CoA reductase-like NAD-dependent aldehyde dehydrogenase